MLDFDSGNGGHATVSFRAYSNKIFMTFEKEKSTASQQSEWILSVLKGARTLGEIDDDFVCEFWRLQKASIWFYGNFRGVW